MWSSENLDGLNGGGWAVFIAPTTILADVVDGTPDNLVVHQIWQCSLSGACDISRPLGFGAVDRWSPLSSCGTGQSGAFWLYSSDFYFLQCALFTVHSSRPLGAVDRYSVGSPDMYGAHRSVRWIIAEWLGKTRERSVRGVPWPGHRTVFGAPLAAPMLVLLQTCSVPQLNFFVGLCWTLCTWDKMITRQTS
jgi:hypothetical protein